MIRTLRLLPALALALACDLPDVTVVGTHLEIAADPGLELCGGTLAHMDAFVERLSAAFSRPPPDERIRYYWLEARDFFARSGCPEESGGCAHDLTTYAPRAPMNHELVHNLSAAIGDPPPFFAEGLAVAFEGLPDDLGQLDPRDGSPALPPLAIDDLLTLPTGVRLGTAGGYPIAGAFTAFLIRTHGLDAHLRLYARLRQTTQRGAIDRAFRDALGVSLDRSIADFEATARDCPHYAHDARLVECAAPELAWDGADLVHHRPFGCDQDDVIGPFGGTTILALRTLEIAEAGGHALTVIGGPDGRPTQVALLRCDPCATDRLVNFAGAPTTTAWLEPGRYAVLFHGKTGPRSAVGMRLTRVPDWTPPDDAP